MTRMILPSLACALLAFVAVSFCQAEAYVDPAMAAEHPDFPVQGEYVGEFEGEDGRAKVGFQVRALGDGRFTGLVYPGGLPGDGWDRETEPLPGETSRDDDGNVIFTYGPYTARYNEESFAVIHADRGKVGELDRVERESPTAGAEPPEDATVLFDGSSVDAFRDGARMTDDGLLMEGALSKLEFEDATIHVEYRVPFMPDADSQARANSGVYIQNRYEVQILDSFGELPTMAGNAALYREKPVDVNMSYPPLRWQTYDIEFTAPHFDDDGNKTANARFTVKHNGVVVHDDVELPSGTGAGKQRGEGGPGPLLLQDHTDPVRFRNVWIVTD